MRAIVAHAEFSPCRAYRYALWRTWDPSLPSCLFIGLNPSTADERHDDPTLRRCVRFARDWGYGGVCMANLFAFGATHPTVLKATAQPIGRRNDDFLRRLADEAGVVVAAWGVHGKHLGRDVEVLEMLKQPQCLGTTTAGFPRHPLYVAATTGLVAYSRGGPAT